MRYLEREGRASARAGRGRASRWRKESAGGYVPSETFSQSPTQGDYVPGVNALPRTAEQRQTEAMQELLDPNQELGLGTRAGGGFGGLYLNVLRAMLKRKLKREGKMRGGAWLRQKKPGRKRSHHKPSVWRSPSRG